MNRKVAAATTAMAKTKIPRPASTHFWARWFGVCRDSDRSCRRIAGQFQARPVPKIRAHLLILNSSQRYLLREHLTENLGR